MCGIAGIIDYNIKPQSESVIKMLKLLHHRGPDGVGCFCDQHVALGMKRLKIIDLQTGQQPIFNEDKSVVVVFNGEIYNYVELKKNLESKGHRFYTKTDTEVIVHLYEEYAEKFLEYLNGMFAIALWDRKKQSLILARDRIGEKPLYYHVLNNRIYFASEIKSLLINPEIKREVDISALNDLLTFNFVPYPQTMFKDIKRLPPASLLKISLDKQESKEYWSLGFNQKIHEKSDSHYCEKIVELLQEAVKIRMRSDVPLGAFLSGGVDSSSVVALMSLISDESINTFSIGFAEQKYNELPYAEIVANQFKTKFYTDIVKYDILSTLPKAIWYSDNPHGDVSFLPTYHVAKLASQYVKVILTGDGGDELFAGYEKYREFMKISQVQNNSFASQYIQLTAVFNSSFKNELCQDAVLNASDPEERINKLLLGKQGMDTLDKLLYIDQKLLLEGNNLVKPDRMGMANSIEPRVPFLDYRVIEYANALPAHVKLYQDETKYILKKSFERFLPNEILYAPKRMFTVPFGEWLKSELKDFMYKILTDPVTVGREYFQQPVIEKMMKDHVNGRVNYTRQLRLLIILELWHRIFIDQFYEESPCIEELI